MKKLGAALIVMLAVLTLLAIGCSGGDEATPTATAAPGATSTPEATTTPGATVTPTEARGELTDSYKFTMAFSNADGSSGSYKVWAKGDKWRMDTTNKDADGEETASIWLDDGEFFYMYSPEDNSALKSPSGSGPGLTGGLGPEFVRASYVSFASESAAKAACAADPDCQSVEVVGQETYKGESAILYEWATTDESSTMWVSKDTGRLLKLENTAPDGTTDTVEFIEVDLNPNIPDSTFELPLGVDIMELPF